MKIDLQPSQPNWTKVCGKDQAANKEICYTTRDFGARRTSRRCSRSPSMT